jgi:hypothetical protein
MDIRLQELIETRRQDEAFSRRFLNMGYDKDEPLFWDTDDEDAGDEAALDNGVPISDAMDTKPDADLISEIFQSLMESMGQNVKQAAKGEGEEIKDDLITATKRTK